MLFRRQSHDRSRWVAVTREGAALYAAQVAYQADERPRVKWLWQANVASLESGLRTLQTEMRLPVCPMVGVLDRAQYRMQAADAPDIPRQDWRDALRWTLKEQVDFPVEDAVLDFMEMPSATQLRQNSSVMVFLVPRADYTTVELAADDVGLRWTALDVPESALRNLSVLAEDGDKAHALMVFGEEHGILVITYKGALLMARHIEVAVSAITGTEEVRGAALSRAALEILRTVDNFERLHSQVQLSGMTVALPPGCGEDVIDLLADLIYVPLKALDLSEWFDLDDLGEQQAERMRQHATFSELCALGATLRARSVEEGSVAPINLLDPNSVLGQSPPWGAVLGVKVVGGVMAVGLVAGLGLSAVAKAYSLKAARLDEQVTALKARSEALPASPVVRELESLRQKDAQQRQIQDALQGSMAWASQGYSGLLVALGRQLYPNVWITGLSLHGDGRDLILTGRTTDPAAVPSYLQRLAQEERFKGRRFAQVDMRQLPGEPGSSQAASIVEFTLRGIAPEDEKKDKALDKDKDKEKAKKS